jgi:dephospho-CoA kinase
MLRLGLTGSIAVGKSFVLGVLAGLGCHTMDADATAREVVAPGTSGLRIVIDAFGIEMLAADGSLDRTKLGERVFANAEERQLLNSILHPLIIAAQDDQINRWQAESPDGIAIIDAALMIESGGYRRFDKLIVVHCRPEVQLQRLILREGLTTQAAQQRIAAQMSQDEKMKYADFLIDTSDGFDDTRRQTELVFRELHAPGKVSNAD